MAERFIKHIFNQADQSEAEMKGEEFFNSPKTEQIKSYPQINKLKTVGQAVKKSVLNLARDVKAVLSGEDEHSGMY